MLKDLPDQKLRHLFDIIDFDHNGLLVKSDFYDLADNIDIFVTILDGGSIHSSLRSDVDLIWKTIQDHFENPSLNAINKEQWLEFMESHFCGDDTSRVSNNIERIVTRVRSIFDENKDGKLSKKEFMVIFVSLRVQVRHAYKCFEEIDTNKDGYISDAELATATKQFFRSDNGDDCGNGLFGLIGSTHFTTKHSISHTW